MPPFTLRRLWFASVGSKKRPPRQYSHGGLLLERETSIAPFGRKALRARTTSGEEFYFLPEFYGACGSLPALAATKRDKGCLPLSLLWSERRPLRPSGAKLFEHERQAGRSFTFYPNFMALVVRFPLSPQQKGTRAACPCPFCGARDVHCALRAQSSSSTNDKRGGVLLSTRILRRLWFAFSCSKKRPPRQKPRWPLLERETGIEPAGISLGS